MQQTVMGPVPIAVPLGGGFVISVLVGFLGAFHRDLVRADAPLAASPGRDHRRSSVPHRLVDPWWSHARGARARSFRDIVLGIVGALLAFAARLIGGEGITVFRCWVSCGRRRRHAGAAPLLDKPGNARVTSGAIPSPSSRGPGPRLFTSLTGVRIPLGTLL
jgi:hypothetical protein